MRVGIDTYSYHRFFGEIREGEEDPGTRWTTWDFLDRAVELGVDGVSLETCYLDLDDPAFRERLAMSLDGDHRLIVEPTDVGTYLRLRPRRHPGLYTA